MCKLTSNFFATFIIFTSLASAQRISYLNGIFENEDCEFEKGVSGVCTKISNCFEEYDNYRKNQSVLKICNFEKIHNNTLICCNKNQKEIKKQGLIDYEVCRDKYLQHRDKSIEPKHLKNALEKNVLPKTKQNCERLERASKQSMTSFDFSWGTSLLYCTGSIIKEVIPTTTLYGSTVKYGDRPNMAAIGWTNSDNTVIYRCGGSIITENAIITAAHCKFFKKIQADTVRVGDRYLTSEDDDENAQQLSIKMFFIHPNYTSAQRYNDIAVIKTFENIIFHKYVIPSCIADLDMQQTTHFDPWTVAGYGETEKGVIADILYEIKVRHVSNEDCSKTFIGNPSLPKGIHESQFCVKSFQSRSQYEHPDTCYGDSGSPLQFKNFYEEFPPDFNQTYISNIYKISNVLGLVSFGTGCGLNIPSVYTRIYYFKDWLHSVIDKE